MDDPLQDAREWVHEMVALCRPSTVHWCDGSEDEKKHLLIQAVAAGELEPLNPETWPDSYLHRTHVNDVARSEDLTFICSRQKDEAGITNHWMDPRDGYARLSTIFKSAMVGRTMYVIPFVMGPVGSPFSRVGLQLTDSRYVVLNMRVMTRMGTIALDELKRIGTFTRCLHSQADLNPERRFICHFPEDNTIWSVGSAYGGNALLGKKCMALRLGSYLGRQEGWWAEHMLIMGVENPQREIHYIVAAFPSACGKTNLAMLVPPASMPGYRVWTVGDDIAWLRIGRDGRLWAVNPEAGFFGVAPGTSEATNPNAMAMIRRDTIFTNVMRTQGGGVWWEGMTIPPPKGVNWRGDEWTPASSETGAHPNARFTVATTRCPSLSPHWDDPQGVPISAIFFGGRRTRVAPLICESRSWAHGVYLGATLASETTAAATGKIGIIRRDPMAMRPFLGYNVGDYLAHWLDLGQRLGSRAPKIFHVNWFRKEIAGKEFLWPGFRENLRPILWALDRVQGRGAAQATAMGNVPTAEGLPLKGLSIAPETLAQVLRVNAEDWTDDMIDQREFFDAIGPRLPEALRQEQLDFADRLYQRRAA